MILTAKKIREFETATSKKTRIDLPDAAKL